MEEAPEFITVPAEPHFHKWVSFYVMCTFMPLADILSKLIFHVTTEVNVVCLGSMWHCLCKLSQIDSISVHPVDTLSLFFLHVTDLSKSPPFVLLKQFQAVQQ